VPEEPRLQKPLAHADLTERIIGGFFTTFGELGHGFSEAVLRKAFAIVLAEGGLDVMEEYPLNVQFRGRCIGKFYADLIVNRTVLVEVKGSRDIEPYAQAQLLNYLKVAGGGIGLLTNFGRKPEFKRMVVGDPEHSLPNLM
jgi:GxxExxY protein